MLDATRKKEEREHIDRPQSLPLAQANNVNVRTKELNN